MKRHSTFLCLILAVLLGAFSVSPALADSTNPGAFRAPEVYKGAVATNVYWTAGTINNGGDSLAVAAGSAALNANQNDCAAPTFTACNFVYANNAGTVAVTTTLGTAVASGNTLLAMIETGAADAIFTNVVLPQQSGTLWKQAAGPNMTAVIGNITPSAAGGGTIGTGALPWASAYIGGSATDNFRITGTATAARVFTLPDVASDTFVLVDAAQTLTSKTLTTPVLNTPSVGTTINPSAAGAATVGTNALPFSSVFVGDALTNNFQITGTATGTRVFTLPDTASDTFVMAGATQTLTGKTLTSPNITTALTSTVAATSTVGTAALPFASVIIGDAATNVMTITPSTVGAARVLTLPDPGGAASFAYTNSTNAQVLANNTYVSSASADPADAGAIRLGNAESINWEANPTGADIGLTVDSSNFLQYNGSRPTDGYYVVPPSACTMELTVGTFAANPATSGGLSAPSLVIAATGNTVLQLTTTAAANTTTINCDFTPPSRLTAGKGITINNIDYLFGYQTTALTSIGTAGVNSITYGAAGAAAAGTVAAAGGAITVTAGTNHGTPGSVTTSGQCYNERLAFGTPIVVETDNQRFTWQNTFVQSAAAATVMQLCGTVVHYTINGI